MDDAARRSILRAVAPLRWALLALGLLLLFNALCTPGFFVVEVRDGRIYGVLVDILNHGSRVAIVALGMTLVIAIGGVDLSVGAVAAIAGAVAATVAAHAPGAWPFAIAAAVAAGLVCGACNGGLVALLRLQPIVATLVLMVAGRGIAQLVTGGVIVTFDSAPMAAIGNGALLGVPMPAWLLVVVAVAMVAATRRTALGLFIEAVGDNGPVARLAGVPDRAVAFMAYAACGLLAGVAGLIECSYIKAADSNNAGSLLELDAILAVVIGGTALRGGRFFLAGTIVGALIMQTLGKTLAMQDVPSEVASAPKAAVVILVCLLQAPVFRQRFTALVRRRSAP